MAVVATHVQLLTPDLPFVVKRYADFGAYGVPLFFVVSALTLSASWDGRHEGAGPFYVRRLFRIAPMFWLAICLYLVFPWPWRSFWAPHGVTVASIVLTATFLHGWTPETINAVVPGGWSVATEWGFYLLFPALIGALRSFPTAVAACLVALVLAKLTDPEMATLLARI
jgi:exopolysaccharide production protein ExoZ